MNRPAPAGDHPAAVNATPGPSSVYSPTNRQRVVALDKTMANPNDIQNLNRELAAKLCDDAEKDPQSIYAGKKVGIANGQIVVIADDWDEVGHRLRNAEPDAAKRYCIEIGADYGGIHEIWEAS